MLISKNWLQNFFDVPLPQTSELADAITFHAFEIDGTEVKGNDEILDIKITPNRGHDCLSHRGIAKEVSAILNIPFKANIDPLGSGFAERFAAAPRTDEVAVTLEDSALSPRYIAGYIKGVKVGPSPEWLRNSLESIGQRSINNVVDATNLVMFNTGQPLHAFDAGKLEQKDGKFHVVVRKAHADESLLALDQKQYTLTDSMLVIADGNRDVPVGIAGIKGGTPAGITEETTDIILESANFNGVLVRKTAQALKLRTDASARFEQVISPELASFGMQNVVELIKNVAGGELVGYADVYPAAQNSTMVTTSLGAINRVLGTTLTDATVTDVFTRLGFSYKEERGTFEVVPPPERLDLVINEDLIEEVARMVGYDQIAGKELPPIALAPEVNPYFYAAEKVREELVAAGYSEVYTSVFAEAGERAVLNKVDSVRPFLRTTLLPGLTLALNKNIPNKDLLGLKEIKLFEIGTVWKGGEEKIYLGTISEKQPAQEKELLPEAGASSYETLPLSAELQYKPFSKYPYIVRDIAMWATTGNPDDVEELIKQEGGEFLLKIRLFDRFEKNGRVSLGYRLIFQSDDRTLTEEEVGRRMMDIYRILESKGFEIR